MKLKSYTEFIKEGQVNEFISGTLLDIKKGPGDVWQLPISKRWAAIGPLGWRQAYKANKHGKKNAEMWGKTGTDRFGRSEEQLIKDDQIAYESELMELKQAIGVDRIKGDDKYRIIWSNGELFVNPTDKEALTGAFGGVYAQVEPKKKLVYSWPMDDHSDFKHIKKLQQCLSDMIKADLIDKSWTCNIQDAESTQITYGSNNVGKILKYNSHFTSIIPRAFHGTSDYYLKDIKKYGLKPRGETTAIENWNIGYTDASVKNVYLTIDYNRAKYYAEHAVTALEKEHGIKSKPIVFLIENLPTSNVVMDDDFQTNMGHLQLIHFLKTGQKPKAATYISAIRSSSQFALEGSVSPDQITQIVKNKKQAEKVDA